MFALHKLEELNILLIFL